MAGGSKQLYESSNGDRWHLVRNGERVFVRHVPNASSGGKPSDSEIGAFLSRGGGPEQQELMRLIGSLVESRTDA